MHTATKLQDGRVLVVGGYDSNGTVLGSCELFDPTTESWHVVADLPVARAEHAAVLLSDGRVMVMGGMDNTGSSIRTLHFYNSTTNSWSASVPGGDMVVTRAGHTAISLSNGGVLVFGGFTKTASTAASYLSTFEVWDPLGLGWSKQNGLVQRARSGVVEVSTNRILVTGGVNSTGQVSSTEMLSFTSSWGSASMGALPDKRSFHQTILLKDNRVLLIGGVGPTVGSARVSPLFNPSTNQWLTSPLPTMAIDHAHGSSVIMPDGKVMITGGYGGTGNVANIELFDPSTNSFTSSSALNIARIYHSTVLLNSGAVLVLGGSDSVGTKVAESEIYYP